MTEVEGAIKKPTILVGNFSILDMLASTMKEEEEINVIRIRNEETMLLLLAYDKCL